MYVYVVIQVYLQFFYSVCNVIGLIVGRTLNFVYTLVFILVHLGVLITRMFTDSGKTLVHSF